MSITLLVRDETTSGTTTNELSIEFLNERITVRELIRGRIYQEVQDYNVKKRQGAYSGLVQPTEYEKTLNAPQSRQAREVDWKKQFDVAQEAFERNGFLILIDDKQAESLDQEFDIGPSTSVTFLKLVPLVGG